MKNAHLKISLRNLAKHKLYTVINILGLALGLAACIVIFLVASYEFGFDAFHPGKESIYRLVSIKTTEMGDAPPQSGAPAPLTNGVNVHVPGIAEITGFYPYEASIKIPGITGVGKEFKNKSVYGSGPSTIITDVSWFRILRYEWLAGNAGTALQRPFQIVLTEAGAKRFFGSLKLDRIIGQQVIYNDSLILNVSGVVKDWVGQTDFPFTEFISLTTADGSFLKNEAKRNEWGHGDNSDWRSLVKLQSNVKPASVGNQLSMLALENLKLEQGEKFRIKLQPLADVHFDAGVDDNIRKASKPVLYSLIGVAFFILLIAVINFINLSTAQFSERAKEAGIRKTLGCSRNGLMFQFFSETFLLTLFSALLTLILIRPILVIFHDYLPQGLSFHLSISVVLFIVVLIVFVTLLAGLYPARVLSSFPPALVLKGVVMGRHRDYLRKGLIIFQFTISLVFIICAILVGGQLRYMLHEDFGFNSDAVLKVSGDIRDINKRQVFAEKLTHLPSVKDISFQSFPPMGDISAMVPLKYKGDHDVEMPVKLQVADEHFIPLYQIKILAGRNMMHSDSINEFVINQSFSKSLGFEDPSRAVGKLLYLGDKGYPIVGVVADFHQASFREPISSQVIFSMPAAASCIAIKLAQLQKVGPGYSQILATIESAWKQVYPGENFDAVFLDESIARLYEREQKTAWLVRFAMIITIFISCIGLFGLSVFTAQKRTKEIGIRKVLGATVTQITAMLCRDFLLLVVIAVVIASPIGAYLMHQWLQGYAYRVDIGWQTFVVAGIVALGIALLTVVAQSIKAGMANPVISLRNE